MCPCPATAGRWRTQISQLQTGRVISYTLIGGVVGSIGSVVSFSGKAKGIVAILAGVFMVVMGLNMLNIFPWLRKFNPRMPKFLARKINIEKAASSNSPLYVGLLNGLMPCGPLQAMQLYALSTGSPLKGALSMFFFSIGTVPLVFGLGALSSLLSRKFNQRMMQFSAMLVVILGVVMFQNGLGVSGIALPTFASNLNTTRTSQAKALTAPVVENGVQQITTKLQTNAYEAITVQKGVPVKWTIQATIDTITGCNNRLLIPEYNIEKQLVPGDNVIEFTPDKSGVIPYSCWMGMIRSKITVVEGTTTASAASSSKTVAQGSVEQQNAVSSTGAGRASCCGGGQVAASTTKQEDVQLATIVNSQQQAVITVDGYGFSPQTLVIQKGLVTNLKFDLKQATGCNEQVIIPELNLQLDLTKESNVPAFTAQNDFSISCWMGMLSMKVKVVDDLSQVDLNAIQSGAVQSASASGGSCCGAR
jgi:sulfite exporter TauE/SafE